MFFNVLTTVCLRQQLAMPLIPSKTGSKTYKDRRCLAVYIASLVHAVVVSGLSVYNLLLPTAAVARDPIYGHSWTVQLAFGIAAGYFMFDLYEIFIGGAFSRRQMLQEGLIFHGFACFLCYLFGQAPYLPHMGSICLLFEISTIPLNAMHLVTVLAPERERMLSYTRVAFAVTFIVVRIFIGVPTSMSWWIETYERLQTGMTHSTPVTAYYLVVNLLLNSLNVFWAYKIIKRAIRGKKESTL